MNLSSSCNIVSLLLLQCFLLVVVSPNEEIHYSTLRGGTSDGSIDGYIVTDAEKDEETDSSSSAPSFSFITSFITNILHPSSKTLQTEEKEEDFDEELEYLERYVEDGDYYLIYDYDEDDNGNEYAGKSSSDDKNDNPLQHREEVRRYLKGGRGRGGRGRGGRGYGGRGGYVSKGYGGRGYGGRGYGGYGYAGKSYGRGYGGYGRYGGYGGYPGYGFYSF